MFKAGALRCQMVYHRVRVGERRWLQYQFFPIPPYLTFTAAPAMPAPEKLAHIEVPLCGLPAILQGRR